MKYTLLALALLFPVFHLFSQEITIANGGFEDRLDSWKVETSPEEIQVLSEASHGGKFGLRVVDSSKETIAAVYSETVSVTPRKAYKLSFFSRILSGGGVSVYFRFYDENRKYISKDQIAILVPGSWNQYFIEGVVPEKARFADVYIRTYDKFVMVGDFDDFCLVLSEPKIAPPWEPSYKITPNEKTRLTAADVVGPDGIVYPDWKYAGLPSDVNPSQLKVVVKEDFFTGYQGKDIYKRLIEALQIVRDSKGGVIQLPEGKFLLNQMLVVRDNNVIIRGAGRDKTTVLFGDGITYGEIRFYNWNSPDQRVNSESFIEFQANPRNLVSLQVSSQGKLLYKQKRGSKSWGNRFFIRVAGEALQKDLGMGSHILDVDIAYANGDKYAKSFTVEVVHDPLPWKGVGDQHGAMMLVGGGRVGEKILLLEDGKRGDIRLHLTANHNFHAGEFIQLEGPETVQWKKLVGDFSDSLRYRIDQFEITKVEGEWVTLNQPLRMPYLKGDGSFVQRIAYIQGSGFENLTIEQKVLTNTENEKKIIETGWYLMDDLWTDGFTFSYARGCWLRGVRTINSGRNPIYFVRSKFCEVRDAECLGALFKGGGGTGYVGLERTFDSLMESLVTKELRHAPDLQYGSSGNVIRASKFYGSDAQWHAGWTKENLLENNAIYAEANDMENGGYGFGLFSSGPSSPLHGPQGPRNVVYGNDVVSPNDSVHMMGGNEGWIIAYNRFKAGAGYAVYGKEKSFDHIIRENVFIIEKQNSFAVYFETPNCSGNEVYGNKFYGSFKKVGGFKENVGSLAKEENNQILPYTTEVPMPVASVPSIYLWQVEQMKKKQQNGL